MVRGGWLAGLVLLSACGSSGGSGALSDGGASSGGVSGGAAVGGAPGAGRAGAGGMTSAGGASGSAGGASGTAGSAGANSAGTACNTLVNSAPEIARTSLDGNAPAPVGGTITDGTYYETQYLVYNGPSSASNDLHKLTITIQNLLFQAVFRDETGAELRTTIELEPDGTALGEQQTCRTNAKFMMNQLNVLGYDATPTTFTIHSLPDPAEGDVVQVFTKQN